MGRLSGVLPLLFFTAASSWAAVNGSIAGLVKDASGAVVPRADVKAVNVETNVTNTTVSDNVGAYAFLSLPVGHYRLEVTAAGFRRYEQTDVTLNTNDELRFDIVLQVGEVSQSVEVATSAVRVETANTQLGDVITGSHMESMPLNGRMFTDLLGLQAGVVPQLSPQSQGFGNFFGTTQQGNVSISGQRETSNGFMVNGSTVDNAVNNGATVVPDLDSIGEFRVLTANFDAEHGNYSGGLVTVVTKSGTNEFHGSGFDYLRNTDLDARSFSTAPAWPFSRTSSEALSGGRS